MVGVNNYSIYVTFIVKGNYEDFRVLCSSVLLAVLDPRVGHTVDVLSPFIPVICHSD